MELTVKGVKYNQDAIEHCAVGYERGEREELMLVPEPANKSIAHVVRVCRLNGEALGWVYASRVKGIQRVRILRIEGQAKQPIGHRSLNVILTTV